MIALEPRADRRPMPEDALRPQLVDAAELGYLLAGFRRSLPVDEQTHDPLREMLEEALEHPGSLIRAQIAFRLFRGSPIGQAAARDLAIAIEYFHSASLVLDDMPMMDDSSRRRGRACSHLLFGEATALLGALALINQAYAMTWKVIGALPRWRAERASRLVSELLGVRGLLDGQSRDLGFGAEPTSSERIATVAEHKTVPLIRLSLVLPAILRGLEESTIAWLDELSDVWGLAYQLVDDFRDCLESEGRIGKSTRRDRTLGRPNLCNHLGARAALARLHDLLGKAGQLLDELPRPEWTHLRTLQDVLENEARRIARRLGPHATVRPLSRDDRCRPAS